ncbi:hypothetical protein [Burkholderia ubonensis]|uniref:hypothetical protein n=1 Tax=Burkholderia ubonensis TaxID=101571 RepID=UPI00075B381D|nr:hypothetical protein [Burkholderia ubonensis]KVK98978.1 hypothetical protein WJ45_16000 [Burkholderia ubonensis]KVN83145.1 hypothetical protein WJ67_04590 [Burkholderia ubonensis]KVQ54174.1 hypothetical protein WK04_02745 [Burkholderia ubonensis]
MQSLTRIDFVARRWRITPGAAVLIASAAFALAWCVHDGLRVARLDDEVARMQQRADARKQQEERARRAELKQAPDVRKIDAVVNAQVAGKAKGAVPMLTKIGEAWAPQVALLSVTLQHAGRDAKVSGEAQDLGQIYAFVERLQASPAGLRAMLLRHGVKEGDAKRPIMFDVNVEQR